MKKRKFLSFMLALVMIQTSFVMAMAETPQFADMPDDWSTPALQNAIDNGLLTGFSEKGKTLIKASAPLTRAQMAVVINKAFNASATADMSGVTDVNTGDWFYGHMAIAAQMDSFAKAEKMRPNDNITREEAFTVLAKVFKLPATSDFSPLNQFSDAGSISDYAKSRIAALVDAGYIAGSGGKVNPKANITRAEFAAVMDNVVKQYINEPGEVTEVADGNIMVNVADVKLKGVTVKGDLIVADGVGTGNVALDSVKVTGKLVVRGGGANSITITGDSEVTAVVVDNVNNEVRIYTADGVKVQKMDASGEVILEGAFGDVTVVGDGGSVQVNGTVDTLAVEAASNITVGKDASVGTIAVGQDAAGAGIEVAGSVTTLTTAAPETVVQVTGAVESIKAEASATAPLITVQEGATVAKVESAAGNTVVQGTGKVTEAVVSGNNSQVNTNETKISVAAGTEGVTSGDKAVNGGQTVTSDKDASAKAPIVEAPVTTPAPPAESVTPPPSTGSSGGGGKDSTPTDTRSAAQKFADTHFVGKANVNGNTVTLTSAVAIDTLTIPAGVTLDNNSKTITLGGVLTIQGGLTIKDRAHVTVAAATLQNPGSIGVVVKGSAATLTVGADTWIGNSGIAKIEDTNAIVTIKPTVSAGAGFSYTVAGGTATLNEQNNEFNLGAKDELKIESGATLKIKTALRITEWKNQISGAGQIVFEGGKAKLQLGKTADPPMTGFTLNDNATLTAKASGGGIAYIIGGTGTVTLGDGTTPTPLGIGSKDMLIVEQGAELVVNAGSVLTVKGTLVVDGELDVAGTVTVKNGGTGILGEKGTLTLTGTNANVKVESDGTLRMTDGKSKIAFASGSTGKLTFITGAKLGCPTNQDHITVTQTNTKAQIGDNGSSHQATADGTSLVIQGADADGSSTGSATLSLQNEKTYTVSVSGSGGSATLKFTAQSS